MHHLGLNFLVVGRGEVAANHGVSFVPNKRRIIRDRGGGVSARYIEGGRKSGVVAERGSTVSVATWYQ